MRGTSWRLVGAIVGLGVLALLIYDVSLGAFDKSKLAGQGWTER
jgi:hypothetical protein